MGGGGGTEGTGYSRIFSCGKVQIRGQSMDCAVQTTDCLVHSQVQSKVLKVSGVALPYDNNIIIIIIIIPYHFRCD